MKMKYVKVSIFISFIVHSLLLVNSDKLKALFKSEQASLQQHRFNLNSIRTVGVDKGSKSFNIIKKKKKSLSLADLKAKQSTIQKGPLKALEKLNINKKGFAQEFLKTPAIDSLSAVQILDTLDSTDVLIDMEIPKGVKEDELNKHELVFYSFQKRTIQAYINSFQKELNEFQRTNPHLRFPLTHSKQKLSSRITYDKNGDILKIETVQWTDIDKLQTFFMDVLQNMTSIPNPPKQIIEGDTFVINYVFTVNN